MAKHGSKTNKLYDQYDDKLKITGDDYETSFGNLDPSSTDDDGPGPGGPTGNMTVSTGIPATNFTYLPITLMTLSLA
jgi:hypothetical protein